MFKTVQTLKSVIEVYTACSHSLSKYILYFCQIMVVGDKNFG